jgi:hypothetical protein
MSLDMIGPISAGPTWKGMNNVSDSDSEELDPCPAPDASLDQGSESSDSDDDSDSNSDSDPDCHPILELSSNVESPFLETDGADTLAPGAADLPEVIQLLQKQLLSDYTPPNHPPIIDPRGHSLTGAEVLSLKHYLAWVDSHGTVKAYSLHAKVLEEAANVEILSLVANVGKVLLMYYIEIICIIQKGDYKHYNPPHKIIII